MDEITEKDRNYFAGLFDGEGCVEIRKNISNTSSGSETISYGLVVEFKITYKQTLIEMQKFFRGYIYKQNMEAKMNNSHSQRLAEAGLGSPENWKQQYKYQLNGRNALYFLKVIEPFCREKKEQAAVGIRYEQGKRPRTGRYGRSDHETERCEFFYKELRRMKHEQLNEIEAEIDFEDDQQTLFSFEAEL